MLRTQKQGTIPDVTEPYQQKHICHIGPQQLVMAAATSHEKQYLHALQQHTFCNRALMFISARLSPVSPKEKGPVAHVSYAAGWGGFDAMQDASRSTKNNRLTLGLAPSAGANRLPLSTYHLMGVSI